MGLTCYRLRAEFVSDFGDAIDQDDLADLNSLGPVRVGNWDAVVYVAQSHPSVPEWAAFLADGFTGIQIPQVAGASAVMILRRRTKKPEWLAFTFGTGGRFLLDQAVYQRGFGLRSALNIVFEGDDGSGDVDPSRLRSVDAKRVGATVLRSKHQVSGSVALEELEVDVGRDLLNGVTGTPQGRFWGTRVTGTDALSLGIAIPFAQLGSVCDRILKAGRSQDYSKRFSFIDDYAAVTDPRLRAELDDEVLKMIVSGKHSTLDLAPPSMAEWERVVDFQYHTETRGKRKLTRPELNLTHYLSTIPVEKRPELTIEMLKRYRINAVDDNAHPVQSWSVWRCVYGELQLGDDVYVLDDGDFYEVSKSYLDRVNAAIEDLDEYEGDLRPWPIGEHEDIYNKAAADDDQDLLLMDRKIARVGLRTNQVELCDLLSSKGVLIHVKRKRSGSSELSHLFAQGFVAGDLLTGEPAFRRAALEKIAEAEADRAAASGNDSFVGRFQVFSEEQISASDYQVVYAILGEWKKGGIETLPFFSKITLGQAASDLRRLGLRVAVKAVQAKP